MCDRHLGVCKGVCFNVALQNAGASPELERSHTAMTKTPRISRRTVMQRAVGAVAGTFGAPCIVPARSAETLVVNAYGGEFQGVFMKTTVEPFEKKFGVKVTYDDAGA